MVASGSGSSSCINATFASTAPCTITGLVLPKMNPAGQVPRATISSIIHDVATPPLEVRNTTIFPVIDCRQGGCVSLLMTPLYLS